MNPEAPEVLGVFILSSPKINDLALYLGAGIFARRDFGDAVEDFRDFEGGVSSDFGHPISFLATVERRVYSV